MSKSKGIQYWIFLHDHRMLGIVNVFTSQSSASVVSSSSLRYCKYPYRHICKNMFLNSQISYTCKDFYILDKNHI